MKVVIIDSISHCWECLLDIHSKMPGNSFTNWGKITPRQTKFVNKILQSNCHVIATMRVKQDYVLNQKNGKMVPEKVGLKAIQRDSLDYEFTVVFDIDISHNAKASKDRTELFIDKPEFIINASTGKKLLAWCNEGADMEIDKIKREIQSCETLEGLRHVYSKYPDVQQIIKKLVIQKKQQLENISTQIVDENEVIQQNENQNGTKSNI